MPQKLLQEFQEHVHREGAWDGSAIASMLQAAAAATAHAINLHHQKQQEVRQLKQQLANMQQQMGTLQQQVQAMSSAMQARVDTVAAQLQVMQLQQQQQQQEL
jgi:cysteine sulfinate desulfinase/cysteine desulfurase-like protein